MRESGILFPIFSLPGKYGIGCFSNEAFKFIDFLYASGQGYWQILPIGPTGFGNSPYQPFSAFAGNPYFISLESLIEDKLLESKECDSVDFGDNETKIDYGKLYEGRIPLLKAAHERFSARLKSDTKYAEENKDYEAFKAKQAFWLKDFCLFMAIKEANGGKSWLDWPDELRLRDEKALKKAETELESEIDFYSFEQYEFEKQWEKVKSYAKEKNVKIIGDLPFYVSMDSADAWSHPEVFCMDSDLRPTKVAGCPPDAFSPTGQLWGNPIYDWDSLKKKDYDWWVKRISRNYEFYDCIRIDHFHGFSDYYAIPYRSETAQNGELLKGPGMDLFNALKKELGDLRMIAEDLGNNTPENEKLLSDSGFPGMKVLQYAFTSWDSYYLNHRHIPNSVVYTGTHDNTPSRAWFEDINEGERNFVCKYINTTADNAGKFVWDFIREAYRSVSNLCIIPLQDYLCFGREARINCPGASDDCWQWRLQPNYLSRDLERSIRELAEIYGRIPKD
ncbi:MAG: 4-alpha-glucanotransferase [Lachnospiraceae bacterium]|nr:4-alpha-glucanotransferase [Lachnospiraceae bacterium]